jgi:esterase/lipase
MTDFSLVDLSTPFEQYPRQQDGNFDDGSRREALGVAGLHRGGVFSLKIKRKLDIKGIDFF